MTSSLFWLPWINPSPRHPQLPAHSMQVGKAKKSQALQALEGIFPAKHTRHKLERAPWPTTASDNNQPLPSTSANTKAVATTWICLDRQCAPLAFFLG